MRLLSWSVSSVLVYDRQTLLVIQASVNAACCQNACGQIFAYSKLLSSIKMDLCGLHCCFKKKRNKRRGHSGGCLARKAQSGWLNYSSLQQTWLAEQTAPVFCRFLKRTQRQNGWMENRCLWSWSFWHHHQHSPLSLLQLRLHY